MRLNGIISIRKQSHESETVITLFRDVLTVLRHWELLPTVLSRMQVSTISGALGVGLIESLKVVDSTAGISDQLNVDCLLFEACERIPRVSTPILCSRNRPSREASHYVLL